MSNSREPSFETLGEASSETPPPKTSGLLGKLRDVLFVDAGSHGRGSRLEASTTMVEGMPVSSAIASSMSSSPNSCASAPASELETATTAALREAVAREIGAAAAEFLLQVEALSDALPDPNTRQRVALSVLGKKGMSKSEVVAELDRTLVVLSQQRDSFQEKLAARRHEQAGLAARAEADCSSVSEEARRDSERLQRELDARREALARAESERDEKLAFVTKASKELDRKELAFRSAYQRLEQEYAATCQRLALNSQDIP